jgi:CDP-6-deoxy-D-xylo-4-hexulose-3-dehydrase
MEKRDYLKQFLEKTRMLYGDVPNFIHTNKGGVNYSGPVFDDDELMGILDSVLFGSWLSAGEKVQQFEKDYAKRVGNEHGVMVNSGSSANLIMIAALKKYFKWDDNQEIILSVVGFPTTLSSIILNGLKPKFVDIEMNCLNFDLKKVEDAVNDDTAGIFISPVLGNPPDMDWLRDMHPTLILDCCDSLGSRWNGQYLTELAVASSHSFYPAHTITTGEGGMITTNSLALANRARKMINWGRKCTCIGTENLLHDGKCGHRFDTWLPEQGLILDHKYVFGEMGYNLKPLDLQGAIGLAQLRKLYWIITERILNKNRIDDLVHKYLPEVKTVDEIKKAEPCWFGVPLICPTKEYKVKLVSYLEENKIQTRNYFAGNILLHDAYKHLGDYREYPNANKVLEQVFFLGCSPNYTKETFEYIEKVFKQFQP